MKKKDVVKHFQIEGVPRSTIYDIIKRFEHDLPFENKPRKERPCKLNTKRQQNLKDSAENRVGISQRKLALKFKMLQSSIHRNVSKLCLKYYKRQRALKYNQK